MLGDGVEGASLLVVAPHALDEVLGCGGVLAQATQAGIPAASLVLFGDGQRHDARRREAAGIAAGILGTEPPRFAGFPENRGDTVPLSQIIGVIETTLGKISPTHLYVPFANSLHIDHRITAQAAITAARPLPGSSIRELMAYEIISSTDWMPPTNGAGFTPDSYVDIGDELARKLEAIEIYSFEMRPEPHARSAAAVERLAKVRGNTVGLPAAEAFVTLRRVLKPS